MSSQRLKSLDILRGFDMFCLTVLHAWLLSLCGCFDGLSSITPWLQHAAFGSGRLTLHDMIMPLFLFCSGTAIPFAFAKYNEQNKSKAEMYGRILRRVIVLWILGMICQGRLLTYNPERFVWYSNTLQTIAVGYAVAAILFMNTKPKTQIIIAASLLIGYWILLTFVSVDGFGGGNYGDKNLCEWVDRVVLGKHCDHVTLNGDGSWFFERSGYTWVLSSMNFIVTVMTGMFAGEILKKKGDGGKKTRKLLIIGAAMTAIGFIWSLQMPFNKHIWDSTMVLVTSGISILLLAGLYYIVDYKNFNGLDWLLPFGLNAIVIYFLPYLLTDRYCVTNTLTRGLEQYFTDPCWFNLVVNTVHGLLYYFLFYFMFKKKIFIRV